MSRILVGNWVVGLITFLLAVWPVAALPQERSFAAAKDLTEMPIERLLQIEVTSVSKKEQKLFESAAAVFVITQEDIRRSGATSIAEVLRTVPGVHVGKIDSNKWAVSIRGFNSRFANKLLVLMDGRSVYTPLFSGVFWETQNILLQDIDRIEVIRGPGATLWGSNAVNGVINIVTRRAQETQGGLMSAGAGTEERGFGGLRFGGRIGEKFHFRTYARWVNRDEGFQGIDDWWFAQGGMRADWEVTEKDWLTFQGDLYDGDAGWRLTTPTLTFPFSTTNDADFDFTGGNILSRWTHTFSDRTDIALQTYYDRTRINGFGIRENRHTFDFDFQHRFMWGDRQEFIWGFGHRLTRDGIVNSRPVFFMPPGRDFHLFSGFLQDEIVLLRDRLHLTLGSKIEHNSFTGFEFQPSGRILFTPHEKHTVWAAVSRAVRIPSRAENDVRFDQQAFAGAGTTLLASFFGDPGFDSEKLLALEIGYRTQPSDRLSFDLTAFFNRYNDLMTVEPGTPFTETDPAPVHTVIPVIADNRMDGSVLGAELAADWRIFDWWRFRLAYSFLNVDLTLDADSRSFTSDDQEGDNPDHQVSIFSTMDLPWNLEFDWWFRFVDELPSLNIGRYATLDVRLGWKPIKNLEISIVGQNLLDDHHPEFVPTGLNTVPTDVERGAYGEFTWRF